MKLRPSSSIPLMLTALAVASPFASAQWRAANDTARRLGIEVGVLTSVANLPSALTISGPPGAPIVVYADSIALADTAYGYGSPLVSPVGVSFEPGSTTVDITPLLTGGSSTIVLPASGTLTIQLTNPLLLAAGATLNIQAAMVAPDVSAFNGTTVSNTVRRVAVPGAGVGYGIDNVLPLDSYIDVEQGDLDGDGDLDTVLVSCNGNLTVILNANDSLLQGQVLIFPAPQATACELVDLDNDNYLDVVVSQTGVGGGFLRNLGRPAGIAPVTTLGAWAGLDLLVNFPLDPQLPAPNGTDIETADIDLDGDRDVVISCGGGNGNLGEVNRLFQNNFVSLAVPAPGPILGFAEVTIPFLFPNAANLFFDDSEDVEFFDLDGLADGINAPDIIIGNYRGPAPFTGLEVFYENLGFDAAGAFLGYGPVQFLPQLPDETLDVVIGDLDNDGFNDIYVANWRADLPGGAFGAPTVDALYLGTGVNPITFRNASNLLPDNPAYMGDSPLPPASSVDAELADYDFDGDLDIFVPIGTRCIATGDDFDIGFRLLHNDLIEIGTAVLPPFVTPPAGTIPAAFDRDHSDIEMGDYQRFFRDQDFGAATIPAGAALGGFYSGNHN